MRGSTHGLCDTFMSTLERAVRRAVVLGALVLTVALAAPSPAAAAADELSGEVLDMACYIGRNAKGPSHQRCAQRCAERGMPLGLLTDDGKVYLLYPKHGSEKDFETVVSLAGARAKITGKTHEKDGLLGLEVHGAAALE